MRKLAVVILAAGRGSRLRSDIPKALHTVCGKPMLKILLDTCRSLKPARTIVVAGFGIDQVRRQVGKQAQVILQDKLLGSGHAALCAMRSLGTFDGDVMIIYCDTPLILTSTLKKLRAVKQSTKAIASLLSVEMANPTGYGRVLRDKRGGATGVVEEKDASSDQKTLKEINVGTYVFDARQLKNALSRVRLNPKKKEYYLTDVIEILGRDHKVSIYKAANPKQFQGANTMADLADLEVAAREQILQRLMASGVRVHDPANTYVDMDVRVGRGTHIHPFTCIEEGSVVGKNCQIGPFARVRAGSRVGDHSIVGNFVEVVRSVIGRKVNAKHLTYLGDARVSDKVNIGAGSITANYDGKNKYLTHIGEGAFIGSGSIMIAPLSIGKEAITAAGSVIPKNKNVPAKGIVLGVPAKLINRKS